MRQLGAHLPEPPQEPVYQPSAALEAVPPREGTPWGLLRPDRDGLLEPEPAHRVPFLTIAVPAVAAVLALGAFLWSGSMRDRLRQQAATMTALQQQNQKLADSMQQMSEEQKAASAVMNSRLGLTQHDLDARAAQIARQQQQLAAAQRNAPQPAPSDTPQPGPPEATSASTPPAAAPKPSAAQAKPSESRQSEAGPPPEIVPPYPTNFKPLSVPYTEPSAAPPAPQSQAQRAEGAAAAVTRAETSAAGTSRSSPPMTGRSNPPSVPASSYSAPPPRAAATAQGSYDVQGNALYASPLAENIEAVQALQRHSTVPLQEFHVHEGMLTTVTPGLGLSVRHPEQRHGTYGLVVSAGKSTYQLKGQLNNPLVFTDSATQREYELVVLHIADRQIYGYLRAMR